MENSEFDFLVDLLEHKQYKSLKEFLSEMEPADVEQFLDNLDREHAIRLFRILPKDLAADTFAVMDPDMQEDLIESFSANELKEVLDEMYLDDTVDVIEEMPASIVKRIIRHLDPETRKDVNKLLNYPEDSAGSIMTTEFVVLKEFFTVADALMNIRRSGLDKETIYTCYVADSKNVLVGVVSAREILLAEDDELIENIMDRSVISVETIEDQETVAKMFDKYDFLAIPVVDKENRIVGIVTIDDAIDVIQEENTEDIEKMAAMLPSEESYFKTSVFKHSRNRILWLTVLLIAATFTGLVISRYENAFAAYPILISFIPMLMGTGGNSGSQASTMIIRGMAMDEIHPRDILKVWFKEIRIALIVGTSLAVVNTVRIFIMYGRSTEVDALKISLLLGASIICIVACGKSLGCLLPIIAKACKIDPAIMATPMISTILDTLSVLIYSNLACLIFHINLQL